MVTNMEAFLIVLQETLEKVEKEHNLTVDKLIEDLSFKLKPIFIGSKK